MSFRFWRRIRLAPGITLNLSKSTASLSIGPPGAKFTISPRGNRITAGIPGTGLFYTVHDRQRAGRDGAAPTAKVRASDRLKLGFFQRLTTPAIEQRFVEGLRALNEDNTAEALSALEQSTTLPDAAWMAGFIRLRREEFDLATAHFLYALSQSEQLGTLFAKYGIAAVVNLPITEDIFAHITPGARGTRLALVEAAQLQGHREDANTHLHQLLALDASDPVVLVSFAELSLDSPHDRPLMDKVVRLTTDINNDTPVHTAVLFYRARALSALGLADAAIQVLTQANRRQKDRPAALMRQIRYHRAELYEQTGRRADARREFEKLYADDPAFEDVASKVLL